MMKWYVFSFVLVLVLGVCLPAQAAGTELMTAFSLRVTVVENGVEYEWEYDSPNHYEYEEGNQVIKGKEAKEKVEQMAGQLQLSEETEVKDLVERVKSSTHPNIERLDIRFMNGESKLFTWVWEE
ncbi:hypothetical protein JCM9140_4288 [Halalkalibacter wakoensis JCM 9140]|uniref:PepSY domain-containing protein n=1 Tax=Halalkalibacter wakoensis JCM 9140 TaxID=1236970 RepID=W4Q9N0_9BACI|nr:hypothetical protein [Halalkalibacter wakoensis]GAE28094.1 hypothetical protein JCM9140_4288 [Halalkalibacter wakoensis JCM 9140]